MFVVSTTSLDPVPPLESATAVAEALFMTLLAACSKITAEVSCPPTEWAAAMTLPESLVIADVSEHNKVDAPAVFNNVSTDGSSSPTASPVVAT